MLMRDNTFHPGNFSTLYKCPKERVHDMVNRLSYDPYERREQLILTDNPEGACKSEILLSSLTKKSLFLNA